MATLDAKKPRKKKVKALCHDWQQWGVAANGGTLHINEPLPDAPVYVVDVENYQNGSFAGIGFSDLRSPRSVYYFSDWDKVPKDLFRVVLVGHTLRTDIDKMSKWGISIDKKGVHFDVALFEHLRDSTHKQYGLKDISKNRLGIVYPALKEIVPDLDWAQCPLEVAANYNGMDVMVTGLLAQGLTPSNPYYLNISWPLGRVLNAMEERGLRIDRTKLTELYSKFQAQAALLNSTLSNELGTINLDSPKQLLQALNAKDIWPKYRNKNSTDKRALEKLKGDPLIDKLLQYSELSTLLSSFVEKYLAYNSDTIHPFISQTATRTGRLAAYNPNTMQIPTKSDNGKLFKHVFVASEGHSLIEADYGQIEPRVLAHLSKDANLVALFRSGVDFHSFTSERLGISRDVAKVLNLSVGYRATKYSVSYQLKCELYEAQQIIRKWWNLYPDLKDWEDRVIEQARRDGYVTTLYGRRIYVQGLDSDEPGTRMNAERVVINNIAQGGAQEICQLSMIKLHDFYFKLLNQIHDSVILEEEDNKIVKSIIQIRHIMENAYKLDVPLVVKAKYGKCWGEMRG